MSLGNVRIIVPLSEAAASTVEPSKISNSKNTTQVGTQVDTQDTTQVIIKIGLTIEKIFVFVTRDGLNMLPYSVNEIYYLKNSGYYQNTRQVYNSMHQVYPEKKWKI